MRWIGLCLILGFTKMLSAQIPAIGHDTLTEIGTWNIEWFGDPSNGPSNEALQYANVKDVLNRTDIDIWSLCEVSEPTIFQNLINDLGKYNYAMASYSQTQKTCLIWKSQLFTKVSSNHVLTDAAYDYDFAGRPPLEVVLARKDSIIQDTIFFYVVHLKAYADQTSYGRRKNAAGLLRTFLNTYRRGMKVVVLGDWNDNISGSIYSGTTESPFLNFVNDSTNYFYTTRQLVDQGKKSYTSSNGTMIDHIMLSHAFDSFYLKGQARVLDILPTYISSYSSTTSDHYPVMGFYNFKRYFPEPVHTGLASAEILESTLVWPVPADRHLYFSRNVAKAEMYSSEGRLIREFSQQEVRTDDLPEGLFFMVMHMTDGITRFQRIQISH